MSAFFAAATASASLADCQVNELIELPVTMQGLRPVVTAKVNGKDARFVLDSGTYESSITEGSVSRLRVQTTLDAADYRAQVAGGSPMTTVKSFILGGMTFKEAAFEVDQYSPGQNLDGVLGQKMLRIADIDYDLPGGAVRLMRPTDCGDQPLAYWLKPGQAFGLVNITPSGPFGVDASATAMINGVPIRVGFSTGETISVLTLAAARRAGVSLSDPAVVKAGVITSDGDPVQLWIAPIKSFAFGGEEVRDTRLRISATDLYGYDLILGSDFFLSHHLYFANSQHKLYVTYVGGPVFAAYNRGDEK